MNDVSETILLEESEVLITNQRAVIGPETYPLSDIISVRLAKDNRIIGCLVTALIAGGLLLVIISFISTVYSSEILVSAFIAFGAAIVAVLLVPPTYVLQIRLGSGRTDKIQSMDVDYLSRIVETINR